MQHHKIAKPGASFQNFLSQAKHRNAHTFRVTKNNPQEEFLLQGREESCHPILPLSGGVIHLPASRLIERVWKGSFGIQLLCELLDLIYWQQGLVDLNWLVHAIIAQS